MNEIIVYRNPLEKAFWSGEWVVYVPQFALMYILSFFCIYVFQLIFMKKEKEKLSISLVGAIFMSIVGFCIDYILS